MNHHLRWLRPNPLPWNPYSTGTPFKLTPTHILKASLLGWYPANPRYSSIISTWASRQGPFQHLEVALWDQKGLPNMRWPHNIEAVGLSASHHMRWPHRTKAPLQAAISDGLNRESKRFEEREYKIWWGRVRSRRDQREGKRESKMGKNKWENKIKS